MKITLIAGARPNFMKIAALIHAIQAAQQQGKNVQFRLVHTGQHWTNSLPENGRKERYRSCGTDMRLKE